MHGILQSSALKKGFGAARYSLQLRCFEGIVNLKMYLYEVLFISTPFLHSMNRAKSQKPPNVGAGAYGIWGNREEVQRPLHERICLAEARLKRHAPGGSMPSEAPKHCKIQ